MKPTITLIVLCHSNRGITDLCKNLQEQTLPIHQWIWAANKALTPPEGIPWECLQPKANEGKLLRDALARVESEFCAVVHAGDIYEPGWLSHGVEALTRHPQAGLATSVFSTYTIHPIPGQHNPAYLTLEGGYHSPEDLAQRGIAQPFCSPQVLFRVSALKEVGGFIPKAAETAHWLARYLLAFSTGLCYVDQVLCYQKRPVWNPLHKTPGPRYSQEALTGLLRELGKKKHKACWPGFARSGILGDLGSALASVMMSHPRLWKTEIQLMAGPNLFAFHQHNQRLRLNQFRCQNRGLEADMEPFVERLVKLCASNNYKRVAFYGSGQHSRVLNQLWLKYRGPEVVTIVTSNEPTEKSFLNKPVIAVDTLDPKTVDAIVLSSASYEREMAVTCEEKLPNLPCLAIWDAELNTRIPNP